MLYINRVQWILALVFGLIGAALAGAQQVQRSIENEADAPATRGRQEVSFVDKEEVKLSADAIVLTLRGQPEEAEQEAEAMVAEVAEEPLPYIVAIVLAGKSRKVIVEGEGGEYQSLLEGDAWRAWTVGKIEATRVEFLKAGESSTYSVFAGSEDDALAENP